MTGKTAALASWTAANVAAIAKSRVPPPTANARQSPPRKNATSAAVAIPASSITSAAITAVAFAAGSARAIATTARTASAAFDAPRISGRSASRSVGRDPPTATPTAKANVAALTIPALAAASSASDTTIEPATSAAAVSMRPPSARARAGAASSAGLTASASAPPASPGASAPIARASGISVPYGSTTAARLRGRRSDSSARSGVWAPTVKSRTASAASATPLGSGAQLLPQRGDEFGDRNADLLHGITLADSDRVVFERDEVDRDAERRSDLVLAAIPAADRLRLVVRRHEVGPHRRPNLPRERAQLLVLGEGQHRDLVWGDMRFEPQHDADPLFIGLL